MRTLLLAFSVFGVACLGGNPARVTITDAPSEEPGADMSQGLDPDLKPLPDGPAPDVDTDGDGLTDAEEMRLGSNPTLRDSDSDGLQDPEELRLGTDPTQKDTDGDGLDDVEELEIGLDPRETDTLGDGIPDAERFIATPCDAWENTELNSISNPQGDWHLVVPSVVNSLRRGSALSSSSPITYTFFGVPQQISAFLVSLPPQSSDSPLEQMRTREQPFSSLGDEVSTLSEFYRRHGDAAIHVLSVELTTSSKTLEQTRDALLRDISPIQEAAVSPQEEPRVRQTVRLTIMDRGDIIHVLGAVASTEALERDARLARDFDGLTDGTNVGRANTFLSKYCERIMGAPPYDTHPGFVNTPIISRTLRVFRGARNGRTGHEVFPSQDNGYRYDLDTQRLRFVGLAMPGPEEPYQHVVARGRRFRARD